MDFSEPIVMEDVTNPYYSEERNVTNIVSDRYDRIPLLESCSFCKNPLNFTVGGLSGLNMLVYISLIYLLPVIFLWAKHRNSLDLALGLQAALARNVGLYPSLPATRFAFGFILSLLLLSSEFIEVYLFLKKFINIYVFGASMDNFIYNGNNGVFGGMDIESSRFTFNYERSESVDPLYDFKPWFKELSAESRYVHVFHHLRWIVMAFLVALPVCITFALNLKSGASLFHASNYFIETMDFALGLLLPLAVLLIAKCLVYPVFLLVISVFNFDYTSFQKIPHSLSALCLQDKCICVHLVTEQVSAVVRQNLKFHSVYMGYCKYVFVSSVGVLFLISFISICML